MPKQNASETVRWKKDGPLAAQLFRDIYFGKYKPNDDGTWDTPGIFRDKGRQYTCLSYKSFNKHIKAIAERVHKYKSTGTGLGTEAFRSLCRLNEPPPPDKRGDLKPSKQKEEEDASSDDSSYCTDQEEVDISLSGFENESHPVTGSTENYFDRCKSQSKEKQHLPKEIKKVIVDMTNGDTKYMAMEPDGRAVCVFHLPSGFDGCFELNDDKTQVIAKERKHRWMYSALQVFQQKGLDPNNVHVVALQAVMDEEKKSDILAMGKNPDTFKKGIYKKRPVFDLPFVSDGYFYDKRGLRTADIYVDGDDAEWAYFWLMDASKVKKAELGATRLVRNRNRSRGSSGCRREDESPSPSPRRPRVHGFVGDPNQDNMANEDDSYEEITVDPSL